MEADQVDINDERRIYLLRKELIETGEIHGLNHKKTLQISKELDKMVTNQMKRTYTDK